MWRGDVQQIFEGMQVFRRQVEAANAELSNALDELNEVFEQSETFEDLVPQDYISVPDVMAGLSLDEMHYEFRKSLQGVLKYRFLDADAS